MKSTPIEVNHTKKQGQAALWSKIVNKYVLEIILLVIILSMTFASPGFLTTDNLLNILRNMALQGCIAFGMTMVIIAGEIDLSIGSTVALTGVIVGLVSGWLSGAGWMGIDQAALVGIVLAFFRSRLARAF